MKTFIALVTALAGAVMVQGQCQSVGDAGVCCAGTCAQGDCNVGWNGNNCCAGHQFVGTFDNTEFGGGSGIICTL
ncbi:hypothetical protein F5884DRAFT_120142 [Xylogone sp. PMI_703]|nr:hypothetical protein F5884DRAFT_120142 [Xylogone sp. PMI_703]